MKMTLFDAPPMTSYCRSIVTMALCRAFSLSKNIAIVKSPSMVN